MLSRRALVGKIAAGVAGGAVALAAGSVRPISAAMPPEPDPRLPADPTNCPTEMTADIIEGCVNPGDAPWDLLQPLAAGSMVSSDWRITALTGALDGSCVLTLQNGRGRSNRIHICRNDGQPQGLAHTRQFDLLVMNGGQGDLPTEEGLAQAIAKVAAVLAKNEGRAHAKAAGLLPHSERLRLFASAEGANARLR